MRGKRDKEDEGKEIKRMRGKKRCRGLTEKEIKTMRGKKE